MQRKTDVQRGRFKELACDYVEQLRRNNILDDEAGEIFVSLMNIMGLFGFEFEDVGTTEEEWERFSCRFYGVTK